MTPAPAPAPVPAPLALLPTTPATPTRGGRGHGRGPAAINPRTITDFEDISSIPFVFTRHPMYPEAHIHMNSIYADAFLDVADLFVATTPPSMTTFVADPISVIKTNIRDNSIVTNALDTADPAAIAPLWARCSFSVLAGDRYTNRRLTKGTLKEAMQYAIASRVPHQIKINIGIQALHFRPGLSYLEWGTDIAMSPTGFAASTPAPAPAATGLPTGTPASAPAPSPIDIATAVAHAVSAAIASAPAPVITVTAPAAPSTTKLRMLFNPSSLPADVRTRYKNKLDRKILGPLIFNPFNCSGDPFSRPTIFDRSISRKDGPRQWHCIFPYYNR